MINSRFRKHIARVSLSLPTCDCSDANSGFIKFRDDNGIKKPVELRKLLKIYLTFIKASQRFYRAYITRLASTFGGIPELEEIAHRFKQNGRLFFRYTS